MNQCTLRSVERFSEYQPGAYLRLISPTPLLMCVAANDVLTPTRIAIDGFPQACEPERLVVLPGGHFDAYVKGFEISSGVQVAWFTQHLLAGSAAPTTKEENRPAVSLAGDESSDVHGDLVRIDGGETLCRYSV